MKKHGPDSWWTEPMYSTVVTEGTNHIHIILTTRQRLYDYLAGLDGHERSSVEVVSDWRRESGEYIFDLLSQSTNDPKPEPQP